MVLHKSQRGFANANVQRHSRSRYLHIQVPTAVHKHVCFALAWILADNRLFMIIHQRVKSVIPDKETLCIQGKHMCGPSEPLPSQPGTAIVLRRMSIRGTFNNSLHKRESIKKLLIFERAATCGSACKYVWICPSVCATITRKGRRFQFLCVSLTTDTFMCQGWIFIKSDRLTEICRGDLFYMFLICHLCRYFMTLPRPWPSILKY